MKASRTVGNMLCPCTVGDWRYAVGSSQFRNVRYSILDTGRSVAEILTCREYWILDSYAFNL